MANFDKINQLFSKIKVKELNRAQQTKSLIALNNEVEALNQALASASIEKEVNELKRLKGQMIDKRSKNKILESAKEFLEKEHIRTDNQVKNLNETLVIIIYLNLLLLISFFTGEFWS